MVNRQACLKEKYASQIAVFNFRHASKIASLKLLTNYIKTKYELEIAFQKQLEETAQSCLSNMISKNKWIIDAQGRNDEDFGMDIMIQKMITAELQNAQTINHRLSSTKMEVLNAINLLQEQCEVSHKKVMQQMIKMQEQMIAQEASLLKNTKNYWRLDSREVTSVEKEKKLKEKFSQKNKSNDSKTAKRLKKATTQREEKQFTNITARNYYLLDLQGTNCQQKHFYYVSLHSLIDSLELEYSNNLHSILAEVMNSSKKMAELFVGDIKELLDNALPKCTPLTEMSLIPKMLALDGNSYTKIEGVSTEIEPFEPPESLNMTSWEEDDDVYTRIIVLPGDNELEKKRISLKENVENLNTEIDNLRIVIDELDFQIKEEREINRTNSIYDFDIKILPPISNFIHRLDRKINLSSKLFELSTLLPQYAALEVAFKGENIHHESQNSHQTVVISETVVLHHVNQENEANNPKEKKAELIGSSSINKSQSSPALNLIQIPSLDDLLTEEDSEEIQHLSKSNSEILAKTNDLEKKKKIENPTPAPKKQASNQEEERQKGQNQLEVSQKNIKIQENLIRKKNKEKEEIKKLTKRSFTKDPPVAPSRPGNLQRAHTTNAETTLRLKSERPEKTENEMGTENAIQCDNNLERDKNNRSTPCISLDINSATSTTPAKTTGTITTKPIASSSPSPLLKTATSTQAIATAPVARQKLTIVSSSIAVESASPKRPNSMDIGLVSSSPKLNNDDKSLKDMRNRTQSQVVFRVKNNDNNSSNSNDTSHSKIRKINTENSISETNKNPKVKDSANLSKTILLDLEVEEASKAEKDLEIKDYRAIKKDQMEKSQLENGSNSSDHRQKMWSKPAREIKSESPSIGLQSQSQGSLIDSKSSTKFSPRIKSDSNKLSSTSSLERIPPQKNPKPAALNKYSSQGNVSNQRTHKASNSLNFTLMDSDSESKIAPKKPKKSVEIRKSSSASILQTQSVQGARSSSIQKSVSIASMSDCVVSPSPESPDQIDENPIAAAANVTSPSKFSKRISVRKRLKTKIAGK